MNIFTLTNLAEKVRRRNNPAALPARAAPDAAQYRALTEAVETNLHRHVLAMWFPRAANFERGGFAQNFSCTWKRSHNQKRSLVYQARLTLLASRAALHDAPRREYWLDFARHGFTFLDGSLRDCQPGGFFWELDSNGAPAHAGEKHTYGHAFAIFALSAYYRASQEARALERAKEIFFWLEEHAHDDANDGYFEALSRAGSPLLESPELSRNTDLIGTRFGLKSTNCHLHLLEAFSELIEIWPDTRVELRLRELLGLFCEKLILPAGTLPEYFTPGWRAIAGRCSFGHDIEAAFLLTEASAALGAPQDENIWKQARKLADHTLDFGCDRRYGGCFDSGAATGAIHSDKKIWWVQAEACNALLLLHEKFGDQTLRYWEAFMAQWNFIESCQIDGKRGGWYRTVSRRGVPFHGETKSDGWTDGYHQGRALMNLSSRLQQLARDDDKSEN